MIKLYSISFIFKSNETEVGVIFKFRLSVNITQVVIIDKTYSSGQLQHIQLGFFTVYGSNKNFDTTQLHFGLFMLFSDMLFLEIVENVGFVVSIMISGELWCLEWIGVIFVEFLSDLELIVNQTVLFM